jgi:hypothetical protein
MRSGKAWPVVLWFEQVLGRPLGLEHCQRASVLLEQVGVLTPRPSAGTEQRDERCVVREG